ncbi:MAG: hypothetical protein IKQ31_05405 [Clostridia bacterium]|nr:hypothetical protein [Clostridia bacterium]
MDTAVVLQAVTVIVATITLFADCVKQDEIDKLRKKQKHITAKTIHLPDY